MPSVEDFFIPNKIPEPPEDDNPVRVGEPAPSLTRLGSTEGLPSSVHTEVAVLGTMLLYGDAIEDAVGKLTAEDFSLDSHQRIYRAILAVIEEYRATEDIYTLVREELQHRRELDTIGGPAYLAYLSEGIPRNFNIESYVRIIKDKSLLRTLMGICHDGAIAASDQSENGIEIATWVSEEITTAVEGSQFRTEVFDSASMAVDAEERLVDNPQEEYALPTGIAELDVFTSGGIRLGELWIIGASPSRGKTTLARQIVKHNVHRGTPAYVHSGEMTKESWYDVTACLMVDMPAWKTREPWLLSVSEKELLRAGIRELSILPLHISDAGGIHIDKLLWNAARAVREHKIKLFAIDYAQIINASGKDDRQKVTSVAQKLRVFAKENNVATLLLSQSPRPEGRSINSRPTMFSLKESGALEEAAHAVILPFRPVDMETNAFTGEDELIIGKQRWGPIGSVPCFLNGKYLKFEGRKID